LVFNESWNTLFQYGALLVYQHFQQCQRMGFPLNQA